MGNHNGFDLYIMHKSIWPIHLVDASPGLYGDPEFVWRILGLTQCSEQEGCLWKRYSRFWNSTGEPCKCPWTKQRTAKTIVCSLEFDSLIEIASALFCAPLSFHSFILSFFLSFFLSVFHSFIHFFISWFLRFFVRSFPYLLLLLLLFLWKWNKKNSCIFRSFRPYSYGSILGPVAGRISGGSFELDNKGAVTIYANDGHGNVVRNEYSFVLFKKCRTTFLFFLCVSCHDYLARPRR